MLISFSDISINKCTDCFHILEINVVCCFLTCFTMSKQSIHLSHYSMDI